MSIFTLIILVSWAAFFLYWGFSARGVKKMARRTGPAWRWGSVPLIILAFILQSYLPHNFIRPNVALAGIGAALCVAGIAFAIWARRHLGRNWSPMPSIQENHELVTSGPYRVVRHSIYTGMLTAMLGFTLTGGLPWLIIFVAFGIMFIWRVHVEEKFMMELFPQQYPEYKKRTKALIPFVW